MKLCACVAEATPEQVRARMERADTDLVEHRIDYMNDIGSIDGLYAGIVPSVVATLRTEGQGGRFAGDVETLKATLVAAMDEGCDYVDVEATLPTDVCTELIMHAGARGVRTMLSYHNFATTPAHETLRNIIERSDDLGADMVKIVPTAHDADDWKRVLGLYMDDPPLPLIAFCMGEASAFTRIASLYYGAPFTYVSMGTSTAPGQLSLDEMRSILGVLGR
ncbi:type I 3-dehydroquinate dehydratase [archaeon]|nr:MAG: type I 3-dehydroquinate dehydratase [archaeon]